MLRNLCLDLVAEAFVSCVIKPSTLETVSQQVCDLLFEERNDLTSGEQPSEVQQPPGGADAEITMQRVHTRVACPARVVLANGNSQSLCSDPVEYCIGSVIGVLPAGRDSNRDAFRADCVGHLKNGELIARGLQIGENVSRKVERLTTFCFKPAVVSQTSSYEERHALVRSS